jgi:hypothetical protein
MSKFTPYKFPGWKDKHSSLFYLFVGDKEKKVYKISVNDE